MLRGPSRPTFRSASHASRKSSPPAQQARAPRAFRMTCRAAKRECDRSEIEIEKPAAERRRVVVLRARCGPRDDLDLALREAQLEIRISDVLAARLGIGQEYLRWTALQKQIAVGRRRDLGDALGRHHDAGIALAQRPERSVKPFGGNRIIQQPPRLIDEDQRRRSRAFALDLMEQPFERRARRAFAQAVSPRVS